MTSDQKNKRRVLLVCWIGMQTTVLLVVSNSLCFVIHSKTSLDNFLTIECNSYPKSQLRVARCPQSQGNLFSFLPQLQPSFPIIPVNFLKFIYSLSFLSQSFELRVHEFVDQILMIKRIMKVASLANFIFCKASYRVYVFSYRVFVFWGVSIVWFTWVWGLCLSKLSLCKLFSFLPIGSGDYFGLANLFVM